MSAPRRSEVQPTRPTNFSILENQRDLVAISRKDRAAVTDDGFIFPITNFFAADGTEVPGADGAARFVAGPDRDGKWWVGNLADYDATRH